MKRLIILLILIAPITFVTKAQIKFGMKAGVTSTSIKVNDIIDVTNESEFDKLVVKGKDSKVGFQGGIFARITIAKIYVQPELLFTSTSGEVEVTSLQGGTEVVSKVREQKFRQIDFPIMLGYKAGPLRLQAGPVGTIMLSSDPALDMFNTVDVEEEFNGATWGYQVGIGFDLFKKITVDVKYEGNLSKLADGVKIGDQTMDFDSRNSQIVATLGFFF